MPLPAPVIHTTFGWGVAVLVVLSTVFLFPSLAPDLRSGATTRAS
jgi:hypothetical protein